MFILILMFEAEKKTNEQLTLVMAVVSKFLFLNQKTQILDVQMVHSASLSLSAVYGLSEEIRWTDWSSSGVCPRSRLKPRYLQLLGQDKDQSSVM